LKTGGKSYLVPLWHHESVFDCPSADRKKIVVRVFPLLPENMDLDDYNILTVCLHYNARDIWNRSVEVNVGGTPFTIHGKQLLLTNEPQIIEYDNCGVPYNNVDDILDNSLRQPVIFIVRVSI
jgi:hypothetical protein